MNAKKILACWATAAIAAAGSLAPVTAADAKPKAVMTYPGIKPCTISHPPCFVVLKEANVPDPAAPNDAGGNQRTVATPVPSATASTDKLVYGCLGRDGVVGKASSTGCPVGKLLVAIIS